ncbi:methyl-accepting chemotaxis protein [Marinimicrobium sp. ABcell2]|uniref:methyl-accepting chemotaxis protein n=1 Tax=Marinimicrobium sp. ABcell2 TaxID=3069751 RepID=UPI0027B57427|nr:methyl-accepting chemotaxis protein [Marinimicrobium sp. ABcell2]MDQ2076151.1 methyl-accepting chemotaxis protein [Marinimicrobium sp. ABcell2]
MNNLSLKWKILLSVTLTCILAVIVTTAVTVRSGLATTEETILEDSRTLAKVLGEASIGAITFNDSGTVRSSLRALAISDRVRNAVIYVDNKPFAWFSAGAQDNALPADVSRTPPARGITELNDLVVLTEAIESDGQEIAVISLRVDMSELDRIVGEAVVDAIWLVLVISIIAATLGYLVQASIIKPIKYVVRALRDISEGEGDLTRRLPVSGTDEISELATCFNTFVERLHSIIASVSETSQEVSENANMVAQLSAENERAIKTQRSEIEQVVVAVKQMAAVVQEVTVSVTETAEKASQADQSASSGKTIVINTTRQIESLARDIKTASEVIDRLRNETVSIGSVLDVIRGVAEQTNLLALNAAIEAARAGEQGRGFAVVADEVRTLASRTQSSTTEIQEMIERLQVGSKEAVDMMAAGTAQANTSVEQAGEATHSLEDITEIVSVIRDRTNQVAAAAEQQSAATTQIESNIESISAAAENSAESSSRINTNIASLADMAASLSDLVRRFKL